MLGMAYIKMLAGDGQVKIDWRREVVILSVS